MGGSNTTPESGFVPGVYGVQGTPSPDNIPSSRVDSATWTDQSGNLWLFGGFSVNGSNLYFLNDLWEYDPSTNEWTWVAGSNNPPCAVIDTLTQCAQSGVYGTLGQASAGSFPGGRDSAAFWTDTNGILWLYGGEGFDSLGQDGVLNDLWAFDTQARLWTWMGGDTTVPGNGYGDAGVYGTIGTPAPANNPGALFMEATWTNSNGDAWLFGGWGNDANGVNGLPNNLWKYDSALGQWECVEGSPTFSTPWIHPSTYGTMGTPAPANVPGTRWNSSAWTDKHGNLWLFGGQGYDAQANSGYLNELWQFDPSISEWTWMAGNSVMNCLPDSNKQNCGVGGTYGTLGTYAAGNLPGGRTQAQFWTDVAGNFWLLGGSGYNGNGVYSLLNDLWEFDPATSQWRWLAGLKGNGFGAGVYGTLGTPGMANYPGARHGAMTWTDGNGNLWLFGGNALDSTGNIGLLNDLWQYNPAAAPPADFSIAASPASLTVNPGQSGSVTVSITPLNGFGSAVSFSCSGLPAGDSCSFSPSTLNPTTSAAASTTLTVDISSSSASASYRSIPILPAAIPAFLFVLMLKKRRVFAWRVLALLLVPLALCTGCGSLNTIPQPVTITFTVTATSGSLVHSTTITVTVN